MTLKPNYTICMQDTNIKGMDSRFRGNDKRGHGNDKECRNDKKHKEMTFYSSFPNVSIGNPENSKE